MPATPARGRLITERVSVARIVGRNALAGAIARVLVLAVWFFATPRVLARLGPDPFGFWSILLVFGGSLVVLDLGLGVAATRFVARLHAEGKDDAVRGLLVRAGLLQLFASSLLGFGILAARDLVLAAFRVPELWAADARRALEISLLAFVIASGANFLHAALQGLQRVDRALLVALPATLALGPGIVWATAQPRPLVALTAVQLGYAAFTALGYALVLLSLLRGGPRREAAGAVPPARVSLVELLSFGGWVQVNALLGLVQVHVDKVLLGTFVALAPVATYELGARMTLAASLPPILFLGALLPAFAHAAGRGSDAVPMATLYEAALAPHFAMSLGLCGALIGLAPWALAAWLGAPPPQAALYLVLLVLALLGNLLTGVSSTVVRAEGFIRVETAWALLGTALHVALALFGLRHFGILGLLCGTAAASLVSGAWFIVQVELGLGLRPPLVAGRVLLPFLLATALAGGAAWLAARTLVPVPPPGRGPALVALGAGSVIYGLVFLLVVRVAAPQLWRTMLERTRRLVGLPA